MYLEYHTVVVLCQFFLSGGKQFLVRTYLVYNTVVRLCQFFCCGRKANLVQIFLLNPRVFFLYFLLCMDLQPYSHDCFSNISRTLFDFRNNTYWVSLFQRNNSLIFRTGVSCFSITLFYSTLLALTDGQNHRQRNQYTRLAWAGGNFFQLCCCVSFLLFWWEIGFGFTYYLCTQSTIQLWCCVSFFNLAGNSFWYVRTQCTIQLCFCVSFFVVAGKLIQYKFFC